MVKSLMLFMSNFVFIGLAVAFESESHLFAFFCGLEVITLTASMIILRLLFKTNIEDFTSIEVYGAEGMYNAFLKDSDDVYLPSDDFKDELFCCNGCLNSTADTNGQPVYLQDSSEYISHLKITTNNALHLFTFDSEDNQKVYRIESNLDLREID